MYFKDLSYFLSLAERGSFREAAESCGVSQPTLSVQLARLEEELNALLIERGGRRARLTTAGARAVPQAARILQEVRSLRAMCEDRDDRLTGPFLLGIIATAGPYLLPKFLPAVRRKYPDLRLYVREDLTADLLRRLLRGDLDAAIISLPIDEPSLTSFDLMTEPFRAIVPRHHPLARRKEIGPGELGSTQMLLLEHGHCLRGQTTAYCQLRSGSVYDQATSVESLRQMVAAGLGCAIIPAMAAEGRYARIGGVKVLKLQSPAPSRVLAMVWRKSDARYTACRELAETLKLILH
jgi:LysR family hydrogen peroxide-inducible transcriptional activator